MQTIEAVVGSAPDGKKLRRFTLSNTRGMRVSAISLGATLVEVSVPDRGGAAANVTLAHAPLERYARNSEFFGCIAGRFANRIAGGRFSLDGRDYTLARNNGDNHLHGGERGFDRASWNARIIRRADAAGIRWTHTSPDGDEGYPGTLKVTVDYVLTEDNTISFEYWAVTDKPTPVNLTNHAYWNLAGAGSGTILAQEIAFNCPFYLPVDAGAIPTGEVLKTAGTPFDFAAAKAIGRDIGGVPGGYDHCMVIAKNAGVLGLAATARDPASGRSMQVWTTLPGVQFYTANFLTGNPYPRNAGFCLETQLFPDSVNRGHFPSCILRPRETFHHLTVHKFSA
ncbi:MAG: aldose epimerase family protein [Spirochaetia bacterium]|jgi:aldose 1-epimerase